MTRKLNVYLYGEKTGVLSEDSLGNLQFEYNDHAKNPLSVRMPVKADLYDKFYAEPFFDNLIPEGQALDIIANKFHVSKNNTFSILDKIGGDCAGAVSLYENEIPKTSDEIPIEINEKTIIKIIDSLPENPLFTGIDNAPRLSLAGAQSKFAVFKGGDNKYYRSDENHPTTHIIKITNKRFTNLLENELFCMKLARLSLGGNVKPGTVNVDMQILSGHKYLEIERYDRIKKYDDEKAWWFEDNHGNIQGISRPFEVKRRHQEDFCQVLGYLSKRKYQSDGGPKIRDLHDAILRYSSQKATDSYKFIELLMFNYLIGNTDAHAKNFSILHVNKQGRIILAPAYDLLSTEIYSSNIINHEIALKINGKGKYNAVTKKDWLALYEQLGLNPNNTLQDMKRNFLNIVKVAESLKDELNASEITKCEIYDNIIEIITKRYNAIFS